MRSPIEEVDGEPGDSSASGDQPIAPAIPTKPQRMKGPVSWLLGPQLMAAARSIVRVGLYGDKVDPRHWMAANVLDFDRDHHDEEFWFDAFADSGDGQRATYSVGYLCQADLYLADDGQVSLSSERGRPLPRGRFLMIGGDTGYHVADQRTILTRLVAPFVWARRDLVSAGHLRSDTPERPVVGIPGNHDYYDLLDGFHRLLRRSEAGTAETGGQPPPQFTRLPGHLTVQEASYLAAQLPFGWWLWGLDTAGGLDSRQRAFFMNAGGGRPPRKLILFTHQPSVAMGRAGGADEPLGEALCALGLSAPPFSEEAATEPGAIRLEVSGNIHHYERYHPGETGLGAAGDHAALVAGTGGAFLHPTNIDFGDVDRACVYPPPSVSARLVSDRLFSPALVAGGAYVALWSALLGGLFFLSAAVEPGPRDLMERLGMGPPDGSLLPFLKGLAVFASFPCGLGLVVHAWRSAQRVYARSFLDVRRPNRKAAQTSFWDYRWSFLSALGAVAIPLAAGALFGSPPAASILATWLFAFIAIVLVIGLILVAVFVGAARMRGWGPRLGFLLLGLLHGGAQLVTGFVLASAGWRWALGYITAVSLAGWLLGPRLFPGREPGRRQRPWPVRVLPLLTTWLAMIALLAVPWLLGDRALPEGGWPLAARALLAGASAGWMGTLWLGWYLAVCLAAGGHYNEAGGAVRIEGFKAFLRICVTPEALKVHVIGVDQVEADGEALRPKLVDYFELRAAPPVVH